MKSFFKKLIKVRIIIIIVSLIIAFLLLVIGLIFLLKDLGVINLDDLGTTNNMNDFTDGETTGATPSITSLLASAKKIDNYMADNGYYYDKINGPWDIKYNTGNSKATCCATYVSWCLQDVNLINEHTNSVNGIIDLLGKSSDWKKIEVKDFSDMQPGDIGIYKAGHDSHTNIYDGNSKFWDAGTNSKVQGKGTTSHRIPSSYVFRYTK